MSDPNDSSGSSEAAGLPVKRRKDTGQGCIVHVPGLVYGPLVLLSAKKDAATRLGRLQERRDKRLAQPFGSVQRMADTCELIPDTLHDSHGYHRECYQRFTMNLGRLSSESPTPSCSKVTRRSSSCDKVLFTPDCIFCNTTGRRNVKRKGTWTTEGMSDFECDGWRTVLEVAEQKSDEKLLTRIRGHDLFAVEAKYHKSCRDGYTQNPEKWRSTSAANKEKQSNLTQAHNQAFADVQQVIDRDIIRSKKMLKLSELTQIYIGSLQQTDFANPSFRGENLKAKIEKHGAYKDTLAFCKLGDNFKSYIVYNTKSAKSDAIRCAYELGSLDMVQEAGRYLHQAILEKFAGAEDLKWPPSAQDLASMTNVIPEQLKKFLSYVISDKATPHTDKTRRLVTSIGQDICRAATRGEWKLPKHLLICMTLRHLFRSEKLITLLNRMGHCENYSFSLELETALAQSVAEASSLLTTQIIRSPDADSVFHSEFDNFDQLLNNLTGMGSIHTAHGIMMQDTEGKPEEHGGHLVQMPSSSRRDSSKQRSLRLNSPEVLPDCYVTQRKSPQIDIQHRTCLGSLDAFHEASIQHTLWVLIRMKSSISEQDVPAWTGFITMIGQSPESLTTIDYYPVIASPITDYKTMKECLRYAEEATNEVEQDYVITTFDLGVCMKAYPLIWNNHTKYDKHIVLIGTFHLACAYMKMVGKKMNGSGLSDILQEAGLIASGSLQGVLSGKHYDRAMHCHKTMLECLERLLLSQYLKSTGEDEVLSTLPEESKKIAEELLNSPSSQSLEAAQADPGIQKYVDGYQKFRDSVKSGHLGKTGQLWTSYMDHIWLILSLIHAVKHNNFPLYAYCLHKMADLFFSFGGQNYARYMTYFSTFIANIEGSHPGATELLKRGAISVARSFIPGNRCAVDKTMEETFMRHAKSHGGAGGSAAGVSGILTNYDAYQRWIRTTHARSQYVNATLSMADLLSGTTAGTKHCDVRPAEILKSDRLVEKTKDAVESFLNPFDVEVKDRLLIVSSGAAAPAEVEKDVLRAEEAGRNTKEAFITSRLETGKDFFEPVKRLHLKTLADMNKKTKVTTSKNKVVQYRQQGNIAFQLFMKSQKQGIQLDLRELLGYPLTPVPYSIATGDGFMSKTDKSKSFAHLTKDFEDAAQPPSDQTLVIIDGNACFYFLKELPGNFSQICSKLFNIMPKTGDVVFSTDSYVPNSVKAMERQRRGTGEKLILKGENTKRPADWKLFLSNDENKKQFIQLLTRLWSQDVYASRLQNRKVIVVCEGSAYLLTSEDGISTSRQELHELKSNQEETDSRIVLYCEYARSENYSHVRVKSPDSDVFAILLHYAPTMTNLTILFDTGTGNKKRIVDMSEIAQGYSTKHSTALMALHAYSGCDTTSAFKGLGKVKPLKTLSKLPRFVEVLARLGDTWEVPRDLMDNLDEFTCALYGRPRTRRVDELRFLRMSELCDKDDGNLAASSTVDMANLPPCRKSLEQHIRRVNYQVGIWKRATVANPDIPDASDGHGWTLVNGTLEPLWYDGNTLPQQLADIAEDSRDVSDSDSDDADSIPDELDYPHADSSDSD